MYKRYCKLSFAVIFLPKGKSDIKAFGFCDIIFVLMAYNMGAYGATKPYESGVISSYATDVLNKFYELNSK